MKFIELELVGYKRMMLVGITYFKITPTEAIQLILGTNGSGKSSLLDELTPLPGSNKDYSKEGSKTIKIEHKGSTYILKSTFEPHRHSLLRDKVELNPGGTQTVQKELVKDIFGITPVIHELLTGRVRFTNMPVASRRTWLTNLSNTDFSYAISVYNKAKQKLNDTSGALRLAKKRLVVESSKMYSPEDQDRIEKRVEETHELLQALIELRKPLDENLDNLKLNQDIFVSQVKSISKTLIKKLTQFKSRNSYTDAESIDKAIVDLQAKEAVGRLLIDEKHQRHLKVLEAIEVLKETGTDGIDGLNSRILSLKQDQNGLWTKKTRFTDIHPNPSIALIAIDHIKESIENILEDLPNNSSRYYSKATYKGLEIKRDSLQRDLTNLEYDRKAAEKELLHLESHKHSGELQCPSCSHRWTKGFDLAKYEACQDRIEKHSKTILEHSERLSETQSMLLSVTEYFEKYKALKRLESTLPVLDVLWIHIEENKLFFDNPNRILIDIEAFIKDINLDIKYHEVQLEIDRLEDLKKTAEFVGNQNLDKLIGEKEEIEASTHEITLGITRSITELSLAKFLKKEAEDIGSLSASLEGLEVSLDKNMKSTVETLRRTHFNEAVRSIQSTLALREQSLSELRNQKTVINDITSQIEYLEYSEICLKAVVKELSPTEGLIAEGLFGFIKVFLDQINSFIRKIWTYSLEVKCCQLSSDGKVELDYEFPISIKNDEIIVPDISLGSTAQKEVIDLAFKMISMKYLGLTDSPLFLDEFASSFDEAHRGGAIEVIKNITEQQNFSQLFMISHYNSIYGALTNAQVCVLCPDNVVIPKGSSYNSHVVIN